MQIGSTQLATCVEEIRSTDWSAPVGCTRLSAKRRGWWLYTHNIRRSWHHRARPRRPDADARVPTPARSTQSAVTASAAEPCVIFPPTNPPAPCLDRQRGLAVVGTWWSPQRALYPLSLTFLGPSPSCLPPVPPPFSSSRKHGKKSRGEGSKGKDGEGGGTGLRSVRGVKADLGREADGGMERPRG